MTDAQGTIAEWANAIGGRAGKAEAAMSPDPQIISQWRPISEIHEDYGPCILVNMADPGYLEIGSNLDLDFDETQWTHFAPVPPLMELR